MILSRSTATPRVFVPLRALEVQAVATAVGYALWMLIGQPFTISTSPAYQYMRTVDEWVWALAFLMGSGIHVLGLVTPGIRVRQLGLVMLSIIQCVMCLCVLAANPRLPGIWTHFVMGAGAAWAAIRLKK